MKYSQTSNLPDKYVKYHPIKSVGYAFAGVFLAISREFSIKIQLVLGICVLTLAFWQNQLLLGFLNLFLMALVMSLEMINTAIELICDLVEPRTNPNVKIIKDLAAGAVLIVALTWGLLIFWLFVSIFLRLF